MPEKVEAEAKEGQMSEALKAWMEKEKAVWDLRQSKTGKFNVVCVDKFSGDSFVHSSYSTAKKALKVARALTRREMESASDVTIATVFYAYTPDGEYLGGDVWKGE